MNKRSPRGVRADAKPSKVVRNKYGADGGKHGQNDGSALGSAREEFNWAAIQVLWGTFSDYQKVEYGGEFFANLGGRLYHPHAIARMNPRGLGLAAGSQSAVERRGQDPYPRGVAPRYVEYVIRNGNISSKYNSDKYPDNKTYTIDNIYIITCSNGNVRSIIIK